MKFTSYRQACAYLDDVLRIEASFDCIKRPLVIGGHRAALYMIDGFVKDDVMEKIMEFLMKADAATVKAQKSAQAFADQFVSYVEVDVTRDSEQAITMILSGAVVLLMEAYPDAIIIDARTYPARSVDEPNDDRVLRGSHDGFVETMVFNTALIRRRIRDPQLTMELHTVGTHSKTDVVLCYMQDRVDQKFLKKLRELLKNLNVPALSMAQESLNEALLKKGWYNPFPKVRYSERPDAAAATVLEGKIAVVIDNSPSVMLLPCCIFDFVQDANDYYFPPVVGTYLRFVRIIVFFVTLFLTPVWYLIIRNPQILPSSLDFLRIQEPAAISVWAQLLLFELIFDGLKLASLNTPSSLSNSFSVVGALILGEFAVQTGWFAPEVILYMAFVAIGNFTQPSFELGYAFKLTRILLIILTALFNAWGFAAGVLLFLLALATNRTVSGTSYLYPLIPFNWNALSRLLVRRKLPREY